MIDDAAADRHCVRGGTEQRDSHDKSETADHAGEHAGERVHYRVRTFFWTLSQTPLQTTRYSLLRFCRIVKE